MKSIFQRLHELAGLDRAFTGSDRLQYQGEFEEITNAMNSIHGHKTVGYSEAYMSLEDGPKVALQNAVSELNRKMNRLKNEIHTMTEPDLDVVLETAGDLAVYAAMMIQVALRIEEANLKSLGKQQ